MGRLSKLAEVKRAIIELKAQRKRSVVFVCGHYGAGKSTFCESLAASFDGECVVFATDWYLEFDSKERWQRIRDALSSGDSERIAREASPRLWLDWDALVEGLMRLKKHGEMSVQNAWNQITGKKDLQIRLSLRERTSVILCDGVYLLHPKIRRLADLVVMLDVPFALCAERARARDAYRSADDYLSFKASFREGYDIQYFQEYRAYADIIVDNS